MSKPESNSKPCEQIITARRIVFRRSLQTNNAYAGTEGPIFPIQQVRQSTTRPKLTHFEAKTRNVSKEQHWSRCKQQTLVDAENIRGDDFRAYENGSLNEFFDGNTTNGVSDVCLMNDHFILVKMPERTDRQSNSQIECIVQHVEQRPILVNACKGPKQRKQSNSEFIPRNRRIQPVESELVNVRAVKEIKPLSKVPAALRHIHWKNELEERDVEELESGTRLVKTAQIDSPMPRSILNNSRKHALEPSNESTIEQVNSKTSPQTEIEVAKQGMLVCLAEDEHPDVASLKTWDQPDHIDGVKKHTRPALRAFQWLMNPFCLRLRRRKRPKPKPKIQAVIYKTYFMRWTKPADSNCGTCTECHARRNNLNNSTLRRIRSAMF